MFYADTRTDGMTDTKRSIQTFPDLHNSYVAVGQTQVEFCASRLIRYTYGQIYLYLEANGVEIQAESTHWKLRGHCMTAPLSVLSPSSILPPCSSDCVVIPAKENMERFLKI